MTWTRLDDGWNDRIDNMELSNDAELMHIKVLVYCNGALTNGRITKRALARYKGYFDQPEALIQELLDCGLWQEVSGGYQVEWRDQESAEAVERRAELNRERQRRYRERGQEMKEQKLASRNGVTNGSSNTTPVPSRPVPSEGHGKGKGKSVGSPPSSSSATPSSSSVEPQLAESFSVTSEFDPEDKTWNALVAWEYEGLEAQYSEEIMSELEKKCLHIMDDLNELMSKHDDSLVYMSDVLLVHCADEEESKRVVEIMKARIRELA